MAISTISFGPPGLSLENVRFILDALTLAKFATSSPDLSLEINSGLAGTPAIALGDSLGSNVVNVALILGATLVISGIKTQRDSLKRDFPVAALTPTITGLLMLDGVLSRVDGVVMLIGFVVWLSATVREVRKQRSSAQAVLSGTNHWATIGACVVGLAFLVAAGTLIVAGAKGIALEYGISEFVLGATLVAVGTSVPELATAIISKLKGHDEVGLGTVLGSNIFNGLLIVGVIAVIHPIVIDWHTVLAALGIGVVALLISYPDKTGLIERRRGIVLLMVYMVYVTIVLQG